MNIGVSPYLMISGRLDYFFSLNDFVELMSMMTSMGFDASWKRAMVVDKDALEYRFYEALILNEAINLKLFTNPYEAMIWLKNSD